MRVHYFRVPDANVVDRDRGSRRVAARGGIFLRRADQKGNEKNETPPDKWLADPPEKETARQRPSNWHSGMHFTGFSGIRSQRGSFDRLTKFLGKYIMIFYNKWMAYRRSPISLRRLYYIMFIDKRHGQFPNSERSWKRASKLRAE